MARRRAVGKSVCPECGGWSVFGGTISHFAHCPAAITPEALARKLKVLEAINATRDDIQALVCPGCGVEGKLLSWTEPNAVAVECVNCCWKMSLDRPNSELSS